MGIYWLTTMFLFLIIFIIFGSLILIFSIKIFKIHGASYKTAIKTFTIIGTTGFILDVFISNMFVSGILPDIYFLPGMILTIIMSILLPVVLIKKFYRLKWKQAFLIWLVWFLLTFLFIETMRVVGMVLSALLLLPAQ